MLRYGLKAKPLSIHHLAYEILPVRKPVGNIDLRTLLLDIVDLESENLRCI